MFVAPRGKLFWRLSLIISLLLSGNANATVFNVGTLANLTTRINAANPGDQIILSNGVYVSTGTISVTRSGTATQPILITAQSIGGAQIIGAPSASTSGFYLNGCSYVTIQGFYFTHTNDANIGDYFRIESGSSHCRITRNIFDFDPVQYWCYVKGDDAEVDHNIFRNKVQKGEYITLDGNYPDIGQRLWVHDNYFFNNQYGGSNGGENIRLGVGVYQLISSWAVVENNLFEQANGDPEAISVKSSDCVIRYNTLTNSTGQISLRSQNRGRIEGNFMLNSSGIRFYGDDALIFNNYLQGSDGIVFGSGEAPQISDSYLALNGGFHAAAHRARVMFNTLVNCSAYFDEDTRGFFPADFTVANNLLQGNSGTFVSSAAAVGQTNFLWQTNIFWGNASYVGSLAGGYLHINPLLATNTAVPFHIASNSPTTNAAFAAIAEVVTDMDGQPRVGIADIGADEFSTAPVARRPLTTNDVGPNVLATNFAIAAMPWSQTVMPGRTTLYTNLLSAYNGFTNLVTLSVSNLPPNTAASFNSSTITNGFGFSVLSVTTSNSTPPGRYTMLITATSTTFTNTTTAFLTVGSLPANWTDADINNPGIGGSADFYQNVFAVKGGGAAISGASDNFHFVYQTWTNGFILTARVSTQPYTAAAAKSGVMIRESTNANSKFVHVVVRPTDIKMEARTATGSNSVTLATFNAANSPVGTNTPCWVRLARVGASFTGFSSSNGVNWIQMGAINVTMTNLLGGLAVCASDNTKLNTSTFDNVSFAQPPVNFFDLSRWKLQLPIDVNGVLSRTNLGVMEILTPQLLAGYASEYFYSGADGAMTFWSPVTGARTAGTSYPRSELREMLNPNDNGVDWTGQGVHTLSAQCQVLQVPTSGEVCIGQIKSFTGNTFPLVFMLYNNGVVQGRVKTDSFNDGSDFTFNYANVGLSNNINYQVRLENGVVTISVNGVTNSLNVYFTDARWMTNTFYFKAGDYCQDNVGTDLEGARVGFYGLNASHAPSITNQPVNSSVALGNNASFSVGATDWTNLTYQWFFNSASLAGKTNAVLNITNVSAANIGSYFVIVQDGFGSVTSSVVTLATNSPPIITTQPATQNILRGSAAVLSVNVSGNSPLSYQWFFKTTNAVGGNTSVLAQPNFQSVNAGDYFVVVTNIFGSTTSAVATLTLIVSSTNLVLDDSWADATRTDSSLPTESAWFANVATSLAAKTNVLIGVPDPASTMTWWTYFTSNSAAPVQLKMNDTLRLTLAFTASGINASNSAKGLRVGLFNSTAGLRTLTDGANPNGVNQTGIMANLNFGQTFGSGFQFLERTNLASANLISTTADYSADSTSISTLGGPQAGDAGFSNGVPYVMQLLATRNTNAVALSLTFTSPNGWSNSIIGTWADTNFFTMAFDTFVFRPALQAQTSTNFTFTEFKVEVVAPNNRPPEPALHTAATSQNSVVAIAITNLLATDSDPDGDALAVTAVNTTSTNGGVVALLAGNIFYTPVTNFSGSDQISYTLMDSRGGSSTGNVFVTVVGPPTFTSFSVASGGTAFSLAGTGAVGQPYVLQTTTNLAPPVTWISLLTNSAGTNGIFDFTDAQMTNFNQRFYRVMKP